MQKKEKIKLAKTTPKPSSDESGSSATIFLKDGHWANVFMLIITHALYILQEPFIDFTSESPIFLVTMQRIFDLSFLNVDFELASNDPIIKAVWISL